MQPLERRSPGPACQQGTGAVIEPHDHEQITASPLALQRPALRHYQTDVIDRVTAALAAGAKRPVVVMPTGSGKTVVVAQMIADTVARGGRVVVLTHRREITEQTSRKVYAAGVDHGIVQAGYPMRPDAPVQIASVATLYARAVRGSAMAMPPADLIVIDECHHVRARTYLAIINAYPDAIVVGVTATPCRGDGRGLGGTFDTLIEGPTVAELVRDGFLVPTRVYAPSRPDLAGVRVERGDYVERELAERMNTPQLVGDAVEHWLRHAERRPTVAFCTGVAHSLHTRDEFRRAGVMAEHIDGTTPPDERDAILRRLVTRETEIVCNAMVLTEGWDQPTVSCCVLLRATKHTGLYLQMVGRVLRPATGKTDAVVLDHAGAVFEHGFVDDPIVWTLDPDRRAQNRAQSARQASGAAGLTTCPECSAVRLQGQPCPVCGWRPKAKPRAVDIVDGDLAAVDRDKRVAQQGPSQEERHRFHRQLTYIANERGYKSGWAAHKFKEKFGAWPAARTVAPLEPEPATRAWVRSRQIAYARALEKSGAA